MSYLVVVQKSKEYNKTLDERKKPNKIVKKKNRFNFLSYSARFHPHSLHSISYHILLTDQSKNNNKI